MMWRWGHSRSPTCNQILEFFYRKKTLPRRRWLARSWAVAATEVTIAVRKCVDPHSPLPLQILATLFKGNDHRFTVSIQLEIFRGVNDRTRHGENGFPAASGWFFWSEFEFWNLSVYHKQRRSSRRILCFAVAGSCLSMLSSSQGNLNTAYYMTGLGININCDPSRSTS